MERASRLAVVPALSMALACSAGDGEAEAARGSEGPHAPVAVRTAVVEELRWERSIAALGRLAPHEQATLRAKVPGRVTEWLVDMGTPVRRGAVLARQERTDYQLRVAQAAAALDQARARVGLPLEGEDDVVDEERDPGVIEARAELVPAEANQARARQLLEDGVSTQAEFDRAQADHAIARAQLQAALEDVRTRVALLAQRRAELALARQQLADTEILAPFEGVVVERLAGTGDFLAAGDALVALARVDPLRLRAEVAERAAAALRLGQTVRVTVDGDVQVHAGTIARLSPLLRARDRMLVVEAELANPGVFPDLPLRAGAFVSVEIVTDPEATALSVPEAAVLRFAGLDKLFVVADGQAQERRVTLGRRAGGRVEVLEGAAAGERVVLDPANLRSGQPVAEAE
ncbi:MAG: efflux RND transporter periplasmic adaptor subunit [Planctomycetota bacterium]|nr:MAG: efflux RND transporter periplasmic adaptor subunit [Planctomycetota bacterium]